VDLTKILLVTFWACELADNSLRRLFIAIKQWLLLVLQQGPESWSAEERGNSLQ
jgi:hypothetical protein